MRSVTLSDHCVCVLESFYSAQSSLLCSKAVRTRRANERGNLDPPRRGGIDGTCFLDVGSDVSFAGADARLDAS